MIARGGQWQKTLTWLGCFGHDLLKPTHLFGNLPLSKVARKATAKVKEAHRARMKAKAKKAKANGKTEKKYYVQKEDGSSHGCKALAETAVYPSRFVTALFRAWQIWYILTQQA